jgi:hypothetical protein
VAEPRLRRTFVVAAIVVAAGWVGSACAETGAETLSPGPAPARLALTQRIGAADAGVQETGSSNVLTRKSASDAVLRSILLPGWGQRYSGHRVRGALFTAADAGIWLGLAYSYQAWQFGEDQYLAFSQEHASIAGAHTHDFYVDIGNYGDRDAFNAARRQQRDYANQYRGADNWWEWDSAANRLTFKDLRIQADRNKNRISYLIGALVLNRLVSAIDASRGMAKGTASSGTLSLEYNPEVNGPSLVWRGNLGRK